MDSPVIKMTSSQAAQAILRSCKVLDECAKAGMEPFKILGSLSKIVREIEQYQIVFKYNDKELNHYQRIATIQRDQLKVELEEEYKSKIE